MRRYLGVLLIALFGLPFLGAAPSSTLLAKPNVIVYPFSATGASIDREAGSRLATILAEQMADTGKVKVIPPPPGTERTDYLKVALANNADYYVTGYITPLGDAVAVVEQVVSTSTGIVVFSQTAQLKTYNDAAGQGQDLGNLIASHANRGLAALGTPPPQTSPTPASTSGPQANLTSLLSRTKKGKKNAATPAPAARATTAPAAALGNVTHAPAAAPTASPAAPVAAASATPSASVVAAAPAPRYAVLPIGGAADAALREHATQRIVEAVHGERSDNIRSACASHALHAIISGSLSVRPDAQATGGTATLLLVASDCSGKRLWHQSRTDIAAGVQGQQVAVDHAVDAAIGTYLNLAKPRLHPKAGS